MRVLLDVLNKPDLMERGITPGLKEIAAPVWASGSNVIFRDGAVRKGSGFTDLAESSETIRAIAQSATSSGDRAFLGTDGSLKIWDGAALSRVGSGYAANGHWSLLPYGNHFLATNGVEPVQYYNGTTTEALVTPFSWAKLLAKKGPHVLVANTSEGPNRINWCAADDITEWDADATTSARGFTVRDIDSEFTASASLGTYTAFYSQNSLVIATYTGVPYYFSIEKALTGIGAANLAAVVSVGRRNFGMSPKGIWATDGSAFEYIDGPMVKDWVRKNVDFTALGGVVGYHNDVQNLVVWHFQQKNGSFAGLGYNYATQAWTKFDYQVSAASAKDVFEFPLLALDTRFVQAESGLDNAGVGLTATVKSKPLACEEVNRYKVVQGLQFYAEGTGLEYRLGLQQAMDDSTVWTDWRPVVAYDYPEPCEALYVQIEFRSTATQADWQLYGFAFLGELGGAVA